MLSKETHGPCFWCRERPANTRDHVLSAAFGGTWQSENIVWACRECNHARGLITGFITEQVKLQAKINEKWAQWNPTRRFFMARMARAHNDRLPDMLVAQEDWVKLEKERLGSSPHDKALVLIDVPKSSLRGGLLTTRGGT